MTNKKYDLQRVQTIKCLLIFLILTLFISCSQKEKKVVDSKYIVAFVGEDTIYVNDIIKRSEYTVRPPYCDDDKTFDKGIILNSIIAEKLYAFEADENNVFVGNERYENRIRGIKEQLMREKLIQVDVVSNIDIKQEEIDQAYFNSKKIVHTEAVFIPASFDSDVMYSAAQNGIPFSKLHELYPGVSKVVEKSVKWGMMDEAAQKAIFNDNVKKGTIIKPLPAEAGYRMIKVKSWSEEVEMSPGNINQQKENVKSKLMDFYIQKNYLEYAKAVMKGKSINFTKEGWDVLVDILKVSYFEEGDTDKELRIEEINKMMTDNEKKPLMIVNGNNWTVGKLLEEIKVHPLEISQKNLTKENFPVYLQAAIASLITDTYLNEIAYDREFNKSHDVNRTVKQWDQYYKSTYQRDLFLKENNFKDKLTLDYMMAFANHLNPYFEILKIKYDEIIKFNPEALERLELTNLQTYSYKEKGPYKEVVPPFPLMTNSHRTNYKRLNSEAVTN